jgi:hypothetical protein
LTGRVVTLPDQVETHVASIADLASVIAARSAHPAPVARPVTVAATPTTVALHEIIGASSIDAQTWRLPVGIDMGTLAIATLQLGGGGGALVVGDARTGKSTLLTNLARCAIHVGGDTAVYAAASTRSSLLMVPGLAGATTLSDIDRWAVELFSQADRPRLVLVDDADRMSDAVFERLAALSDPTIAVIVAGRGRELSVAHHWTAPMRSQARGVVLRPLAGDGVLFGIQLRVSPVEFREGRGLLIDNGQATPILLADPTGENSGDLR